MATALARMGGSILGGAVRDLISHLSQNLVAGYIVVFAVMAALMMVSLLMLRQLDVTAFRQRAEEPSLVERVALASEI